MRRLKIFAVSRLRTPRDKKSRQQRHAPLLAGVSVFDYAVKRLCGFVLLFLAIGQDEAKTPQRGKADQSQEKHQACSARTVQNAAQDRIAHGGHQRPQHGYH